ncbi:MAG: family 16 glycosylhydrolase [Candidatus Azobacteroides sp.]|nr:family 16 glycosylhydrolase [Candidatus Azobacteroides sp.]
MFYLKKIIPISFLFFLSFPGMYAHSNEDEYYLVWEDSFDGPELDEANTWTAEISRSGGGNNELQYYIRENISIGQEPQSGESCLIITAKKENYGSKTCTSGRLNTYGKMSFKYGKLEARIKLPKTANGLWPAFWMLGNDFHTIGWPASGEIDILEMGAKAGIQAGTQDRFFNGACHWGPYWQVNNPIHDEHVTAPYSLQDDFHLFTLIWDKNAMKMYLDMDIYPDNPPYLELAIDNVDNLNSPGHYFHKPFFVIFNVAIGGDFVGIWNILEISALNNANNFQANMYVDYVRLYQKGDEEEELHIAQPTGIESSSVEETIFSLHHNPQTGELAVRGNEIPQQITIYNLMGQKVGGAENTDKINVSSLSQNMYVVELQTNSGKTEVYKVKL